MPPIVPTDAPPRAGRLIEAAGGLVDLATGLPARLVTEPAACGISTPAAAGRWPGETVVDEWTAQDWLGRWQQRRLLVPAPNDCRAATAATAPPAAITDGARGDAIGITRATYDEWLGIAAHARAAGQVPVHASMLALVPASRRLLPLVVCVPASDPVAALPHLDACLARGATVALLVSLPGDGCSSTTRDAASDASAHAQAGIHIRQPDHAARIRHVRRALRSLPRAPRWPAATWIAPRGGGRPAMTHLELLDVSTQIEDARRDDEALAMACRAARQHTRADHAAIVFAPPSGPLVVVASDGPDAGAPQAWSQLCRDDGPAEIVSSEGWHTAARHDRDDGATVWIHGRWRTREHGTGVCELLSVFARLVAPRIAARLPRPDPGGLEDTLVGSSIVMHDVRAQIALAARAPFPVLIRGESGCGKELAARAIHALGPRRHRRCATINCAALPDELIESELFGHVRGAFTGAATDRAGLFDDADGGTLLLDEVGELGGRAQAKLLRVLQDGEVRRVGENHARRVDVRVIAATNASLEDAVRRGTFRADLFYRLDVVRVRMPALRERREDIPGLAQHFWRDCTARVGSRARLEGRALEALVGFDWPGNVRQLQNTLAALAVRAPARGRIGVDDLPPEIRRHGVEGADGWRGGLDAARREFEATYVREALTRAGGRPSMAARDLGVSRQGLSKLVRRLGLEDETPGQRLP